MHVERKFLKLFMYLYRVMLCFRKCDRSRVSVTGSSASVGDAHNIEMEEFSKGSMLQLQT